MKRVIRRGSSALHGVAVCMLVAVVAGAVNPGGAHLCRAQDPPKAKSTRIPKPPVKNFRVPEELRDTRLGDQLLLLMDDFWRAEEIGSSGKPMEEYARNTGKLLKKLDYPHTHYFLGKAYVHLRRLDEAEEHLRLAIAGNEKFYEAFTELGLLLGRKRQHREAVAALEKALAIYDHYVPALDGIGLALVRVGRAAQASPYLVRAQAVEESDDRDLLLIELEDFVGGPGWEQTHTAESEHFKVFNGASVKNAERIADRAERALRFYQRLFPDLEPGPDLHEIYVYRHADEDDPCEDAGVDLFDGGHYSTYFRRLKICQGNTPESYERALLRQVFLQIILDQVDELPVWLAEGCKDYFGSANMMLLDDKNLWVRPDRLQNGIAVTAIRYGRTKPMEVFMTQNATDFFADEGTSKAQAWSVVFFCLQSGKQKYMKTLRAYVGNLLAGKTPAECYARTFGKLSEKRLVSDWKKYICDELPRITR